MDRLIDLTDGYFALLFPYHIVSDMTVSMALPKGFKKQVNYKHEDKETAGKHRMDSNVIERGFPIEVAMAKSLRLKLSNYILIKAI